ncbi:hypothetical protein D9M72_635570 [compost metagenome]
MRDKTAEKLLVTRRAQLAHQLLHEVCKGVILLDGVIRVVGDVNQQRSIKATLLVNIIALQHGFDQSLGAIGEKCLQQLELIEFLSR